MRLPAINLKLNKGIFIPKFYPYLFDYSHRWEFWVGSAGSGKSYTIAQRLIIRACREPIRILVCRRYASTLRNTCFSLLKEILTKWQLYPRIVKIRETDFNIKFPNGSEIIFSGLDEETKLLSLNNISTVWIEEAYEVEKSKIEQLNLRMRGEAANQQIIMSWNPISKQSYLYEFSVENPPQNSIYLHSTYKDNPFLSAEYVAALDEMETRNPAKYRVYGRGEWGINVEAKVFNNYKVEAFDAMELAAKGFVLRCGIDLGWIDKTAIIQTLYDRENKTIYVCSEFYKSGCQLSEIAAAIKEMGITKSRIYVDSAEPRSIQYLRNEGINAAAAIKGKDTVKAGYMFLQDNQIIIHPSCSNMIMELDNLCYAKSKLTGEYTDDFENHAFTHACDAARYAYSDIYTNKSLKTINKAALSL